MLAISSHVEYKNRIYSTDWEIRPESFAECPNSIGKDLRDAWC